MKLFLMTFVEIPNNRIIDSTPSHVKQPDLKHPKFGPLFTDSRLGALKRGIL